MVILRATISILFLEIYRKGCSKYFVNILFFFLQHNKNINFMLFQCKCRYVDKKKINTLDFVVLNI